MRLRPFALLLVSSLALAGLAHADGSKPKWELFDEEDGIKMYRHDVAGSSIVALRGEGFVAAPIQRYSEKNGGDDKITCAATESAHRDAMAFLNSFEG